jgi:methylase of polypeptide subunit release factors
LYRKLKFGRVSTKTGKSNLLETTTFGCKRAKMEPVQPIAVLAAHVSPPAPSGTNEQIEQLRQDLLEANFTVAGVRDLLGPTASAALDREEANPGLRAVSRVEPKSALATLVDVLLLGGTSSATQFDEALPSLGSDGARQIGLVSIANGQVKAQINLAPYSAEDAEGDINWWIAADLDEAIRPGVVAPDHVMGIGGATQLLALVTVRDPVERSLDVGTGSGLQALHLTRHSTEVVATDISERALGFARFNAALNLSQDHGIDFRLGSMLEPVANQKFDLIVSNPPFVISRTSATNDDTDAQGTQNLGKFDYRETGQPGDQLVQELLAGVGQHLTPHGTAQFLANWEIQGSDDWKARVQGWCEQAAKNGTSSLVIQREVLDPAQYAELWIRDGGTTKHAAPSDWNAAYQEWLSDFATRNVTAIGMGLVNLRNNGDPATIRLEQQLKPLKSAMGAHLSQTLDAMQWAASASETDILTTKFILAEDVTEVRYFKPGASDPSIIMLTQGGGFAREHQASTALAGFVGASDGDLTASQIIGALASILNIDDQDLNAELLPKLRELITTGFLSISD